jgi:hypothetical protein
MRREKYMKSLNKTLSLLGIILLASCGTVTRYEYMVFKDVPLNPSITVLPETQRDVDYARDIERELIKLGQRVINPPPMRKVEKSETDDGLNKGTRTVDAENDRTSVTRAEGRSTNIVETYWNVIDLKSTHAFYVNDSKWSIRVIDVSSGQVLAVSDMRPKVGFSSSNAARETEMIVELLKALEFKYKEPPVKN